MLEFIFGIELKVSAFLKDDKRKGLILVCFDGILFREKVLAKFTHVIKPEISCAAKLLLRRNLALSSDNIDGFRNKWTDCYTYFWDLNGCPRRAKI